MWWWHYGRLFIDNIIFIFMLDFMRRRNIGFGVDQNKIFSKIEKIRCFQQHKSVWKEWRCDNMGETELSTAFFLSCQKRRLVRFKNLLLGWSVLWLLFLVNKTPIWINNVNKDKSWNYASIDIPVYYKVDRLLTVSNAQQIVTTT